MIKLDKPYLDKNPIEKLKILMSELREKCPWDSVQTHDTIAPYTIEEAYEVSEAIANKDMMSLKEELGDLLFQVIFQSKIAEENEFFNFDDVCETLFTKMVNRHPHVFDHSRNNADSELIENWEKTKENERNKKGFNSLLDDIPIALPELMRAIKLQKRAARVNFDWPNIDGVLEKIAEESKELSEAIEIKSYDSVKEEMGDLLFTLVNLSRKLNVDPELALRETNTKFIRRFSFIESAINNNGENINFVSQNKLENLWLASKTIDA